MNRWLVASLSVLLCLLVGSVELEAQGHTWSRGSFSLPFAVSWNKTKLEPGDYRFRVTTLTTGQVLVYVEREGNTKVFGALHKEFVEGGKGLEKQLEVEFDPEFGPEVVEMELPGRNWRLRFGTHKKKTAETRVERRESLPLKID